MSPSPTLFRRLLRLNKNVCSHRWLNVVGRNGAEQRNKAERIRSPVAVWRANRQQPFMEKTSNANSFFSPAQISIPCQAPAALICSSSRIMTAGRGRERQKLTGIKGAGDFFFFLFCRDQSKIIISKLSAVARSSGSNLSGQGVGSEFIWIK